MDKKSYLTVSYKMGSSPYALEVDRVSFIEMEKSMYEASLLFLHANHLPHRCVGLPKSRKEDSALGNGSTHAKSNDENFSSDLTSVFIKESIGYGVKAKVCGMF